MITRCAGAAALSVWCAPALAGQIATVAQIDAILGDQVTLEDFEGVSISGGGTVSAPNPLNASTQPPTWGILPGISYQAAGSLALHAGFLDGDSSNILQGGTLLTLTFDQPQRAAGFRVIDSTGNIPYHDTITFFHNAQVLGTLEFDLPPATDTFAGWEDGALGVTSITIASIGTGFSGLPTIDNVEWGIVVTPPACVGDITGDGVTNSADFNVLAGDFGCGG